MYLEYYLQIRLTHLIFQRASGEMLPYNFIIFPFFFLFKLHTVKLKVLNLFCFVF